MLRVKQTVRLNLLLKWWIENWEALNLLWIFVPTLTYDHRLWAVSERPGSQIPVQEDWPLSACLGQEFSNFREPLYIAAQGCCPDSLSLSAGGDGAIERLHDSVAAWWEMRGVNREEDDHQADRLCGIYCDVWCLSVGSCWWWQSLKFLSFS